MKTNNALAAEHEGCFGDEERLIDQLLSRYPVSPQRAGEAEALAGEWVRAVREDDSRNLFDDLFAEYSLSNAEGVALMSLAESLLRVPDAATLRELIADKISGGGWREHLGASESFMVNSTTWGLFLTDKIIQNQSGALGQVVNRLGEPLTRRFIIQAVKLLAHKFIYAETIEDALSEKRMRGRLFSFDMLGEGARTDAQAEAYYAQYHHTLQQVAAAARSDEPIENSGVSLKLSAIHPRLEYLKAAQAKADLRDKLIALFHIAMRGNVAVTIDAEEFSRLGAVREVIAEALAEPSLRGWRGFGSVIQAYGKWAPAEIDWYYALARRLNARFSLRLVKGAYWDAEIKEAQRENYPGYPVYTKKHNSDISYMCCAAQLQAMSDCIYPQFATHNAYTLAYICALYRGGAAFEVQRLFGMGEAVHRLTGQRQVSSRIYAPVGVHRDLLSYLVRRLLENGASQSFINQLAQKKYRVEEVVKNPLTKRAESAGAPICPPSALYAPARQNSAGWFLHEEESLTALRRPLQSARRRQWEARSILAGSSAPADGEAVEVINPADAADKVGVYVAAPDGSAEAAVAAAQPWRASAAERRRVLSAAADALEQNRVIAYSLLQREAGKVIGDAIAEVREAADFLRYYGSRCDDAHAPAGRVACISPWNFPLAIFTGQIAAALAAGNAALAKPSENTCLIAHFMTSLLHAAGAPVSSLQLLTGDGKTGAALCRQPGINAAAFTGSNASALRISRTLAECASADYNLVAETGGINAMIVDSSALPHQAVNDIILSAFHSAGQRCSALRMLYVQEEIYEEYVELIRGAMAVLTVGDPQDLSADIGPVIHAAAKDSLQAYAEDRRRQGRMLAETPLPRDLPRGHYLPPALIAADGIGAIEQEVFGPVLHIAPYRSGDMAGVLAAINSSGYGLTFAIHSRIEARLAAAADSIKCGNIYINRDQIGAIVESQPFGGHGLSGTGPKAGGELYMNAFYHYAAGAMPGAGAGASAAGADVAGAAAGAEVPEAVAADAAAGGGAGMSGAAAGAAAGGRSGMSGVAAGEGMSADSGADAAGNAAGDGAITREELQAQLSAAAAAIQPQEQLKRRQPGITGEENIYSVMPRGVVLCLGPAEADIKQQQALCAEHGCAAVTADASATQWLDSLTNIDAVMFFAAGDALRKARQHLAARDGAIIPLLWTPAQTYLLKREYHTCINTTSLGGNVQLLAEQ